MGTTVSSVDDLMKSAPRPVHEWTAQGLVNELIPVSIKLIKGRCWIGEKRGMHVQCSDGSAPLCTSKAIA